MSKFWRISFLLLIPMPIKALEFDFMPAVTFF